MKPPKNFYSTLDRRKQGLPEVPTPSAGDVGKVIKAGSNGYELASDAGAKLVLATVTADGQGNLSCDKTYSELSTSIINGDIVELSYLSQTFVFSGIDLAGIHFALAKSDSNGHNVITAWTISNSDVITFIIEEINSELPSYSSADEGKFLGVDNAGSLKFANVPNELPAYSSSDNGKVLAVDNNGDLEFVGISSDIVVIRCTWNESSQINLPNGMTQNDLVALYKAGKIPILDCTSTTESSVLRLIMYMYRTTQSSGKMAIEFSSFYYYSGVKIRTASAKDENTYNYLTIESH